jgi:membrane fusion protein (multidrug efflux system)
MRHAVLFGAAVVALGAGVVLLMSWDGSLSRRINPETEDAYFEGEYTVIAAHVQAYVRRIAVDDNQPVTPGQVLVELEDEDYRARTQQAEANVAQAQAALHQLDARAAAARLQAEQARTQVTAAEATLLRDSQEDRRQRVLLPTDVGLLRTAQTADADRRRSMAQLEQTRAAQQQAERQMDLIAAQRRSAAASVDVQRAALALARITQSYTTIRAPREGVVGPRQVRPGTLVQPGTELISLTPLQDIWVVANYNERQITNVQTGQPARVRVDAFPRGELAGHVAGVAPATGATFSGLPADNTTGNYTKVAQRLSVKIALDDRAQIGLLRPGMSAVARIITDPASPGQSAREVR